MTEPDAETVDPVPDETPGLATGAELDAGVEALSDPSGAVDEDTTPGDAWSTADGVGLVLPQAARRTATARTAVARTLVACLATLVTPAT